jgi:hypothetical protein
MVQVKENDEGGEEKRGKEKRRKKEKARQEKSSLRGTFCVGLRVLTLSDC